MKKLSLILSMLSIYVFSFSQVDSTSTQIDSTKIIYCEIVGTQAFGKVTVVIDMGESKGFLGLNASVIMDETTGKRRKFNSMIDALNFMGSKSWDFVQAYAVTMGNTNVYHFLLKQTIAKGLDGNYYPVTRKVYSSVEEV